MFCSNCGAEINEKKNFCPKCGAKYDVKKDEFVRSSNQGETNNKEQCDNVPSKKKKGPVVVLTFVVIIVIGFVIAIVVAKHRNNEKQKNNSINQQSDSESVSADDSKNESASDDNFVNEENNNEEVYYFVKKISDYWSETTYELDYDFESGEVKIPSEGTVSDLIHPEYYFYPMNDYDQRFKVYPNHANKLISCYKAIDEEGTYGYTKLEFDDSGRISHVKMYDLEFSDEEMFMDFSSVDGGDSEEIKLDDKYLELIYDKDGLLIGMRSIGDESIIYDYEYDDKGRLVKLHEETAEIFEGKKQLLNITDTSVEYKDDYSATVSVNRDGSQSDFIYYYDENGCCLKIESIDGELIETFEYIKVTIDGSGSVALSEPTIEDDKTEESDDEKGEVDEENITGKKIKKKTETCSDYPGQVKSEEWYDEEGKVTERKIYSTGPENYVSVWNKFIYDDNGNMIRKEDQLGDENGEYEYDDNGNMISSQETQSTGTVFYKTFEYNSDGKKTRVKTSYDGEVHSDLSYEYSYEYESDYYTEKITIFDYVGNRVFDCMINKYDMNDNLIEQDFCDNDGNETGSFLKMEYDSNGNEIGHEQYEKNELYISWNNEYNSDGLLVKTNVTHYTDRTFDNTTTYEYEFY